MIMAISLLSGCAESSALIKANSTSLRTDVFEELTGTAIASQGYADLRVMATLKTHKPGIFSAKDIHGTPDYKLLLNIDGQAVQLQGTLRSENSEPMKLVDPEAGDGIRYRFSKNIRLKAGTYRVVVALPDDGIAVERTINLAEGGENDLVLEPVYRSSLGRRRPGVSSSSSFLEGIVSMRLILNGREI